LNKQDLADPARTEAWLAWYREQPDTHAIGLDASDKTPAQRLMPPAANWLPIGAAWTSLCAC
jgi:ribosome biogenesis GTPase A